LNLIVLLTPLVYQHHSFSQCSTYLLPKLNLTILLSTPEGKQAVRWKRRG